MDKQTNTSKQIIDHRTVAKHGIGWAIGVIIGIIVGSNAKQPIAPPAADRDADLVQVTSTALDRGGDYWAAHLEPRVWRPAHVVLISHDERTACGVVGKTTGPVYCPTNERAYVDLSFLRTIKGDLARAYVLAHELGHHIQKLRGETKGRDSVSIELQADCYAGMWMRAERDGGHINTDDIADAIAEAARVGDDQINPGSSPETWTHGSAEQRTAALAAGIAGGPCLR